MRGAAANAARGLPNSSNRARCNWSLYESAAYFRNRPSGGRYRSAHRWFERVAFDGGPLEQYVHGSFYGFDDVVHHWRRSSGRDRLAHAVRWALREKYLIVSPLTH